MCEGTPIIIVPAGFSDLFTMLNVKDFFENGVYVFPFCYPGTLCAHYRVANHLYARYVSNMQKKSEGARKEQSFTVTHEENGEKFVFKVVDSVRRFTDRHW